MAHDEGGSNLVGPGLLLIAAVLGFILSNSPLAGTYQNFLDTELALRLGTFEILNKPILLVVNDGLMAVFFLFIGLELKREILVGELSDPKQAIMPVFAAVGGMLIPALIFFSLNPTGPGSRGWGIPMATDIAFALGLLAVLGNRVSSSLKVMLAAIAIVDDLGAIAVIALFYTSQIKLGALGMALLCAGVAFVMNRRGVMRLSLYMLVGIPLWYFTLKSGVHATIAGVLLAATIPLSPRDAERSQLISDIFAKKASPLDSPAVFLEKSLFKWVSFLVVPVFAFCNAGVTLGGSTMTTVSLGIILGLVVGKPLGIVGFSFAAKLAGLAGLPTGLSWRQVVGIGFLAGIGFTMSLFVSSLAFQEPSLHSEAKLAVMLGSLASAVIGVLFLIKTNK